jgi:hypothetical protein
MRSLPVTALLVLAAFVLGLALGGQTPREAAALTSPEIGWKVSGETLVISNNTTDKGFLARGSLQRGSGAEVPPTFVQGILKVSRPDLDRLLVSRLQPILVCDPTTCRSCDEMPTLCEMPPRPIPQDQQEIQSTMGRQ